MKTTTILYILQKRDGEAQESCGEARGKGCMVLQPSTESMYLNIFEHAMVEKGSNGRRCAKKKIQINVPGNHQRHGGQN